MGGKEEEYSLLPPLARKWVGCPRCGKDYLESESRGNIRKTVRLSCPSCGETTMRKPDGPLSSGSSRRR
jgi:transposase-like protein